MFCSHKNGYGVLQTVLSKVDRGGPHVFDAQDFLISFHGFGSFLGLGKFNGRVKDNEKKMKGKKKGEEERENNRGKKVGKK